MSKGKGKQVATKPDWKEQLAMLDKAMGWDEEDGTDWADRADSSEAENQQVYTPTRPHQSKSTNKNLAKKLQSNGLNHSADTPTEEDIASGAMDTDYDYAACCRAQKYFDKDRNGTCHEPSGDLEDGIVLSEAVQKILLDEAKRSRLSDQALGNGTREGPSTNALYDDSDDDQIQDHVTRKQQNHHQEEKDGEKETDHEEQDQEEHVQPKKNELKDSPEHHSGSDTCSEDALLLNQYLCDSSEEGKKKTREFFAQVGCSCLIKDPCVLLPHPQDALPGTEDVDKPVLTVTTPEGETLYPHDLEEYLEPPPPPPQATHPEQGISRGGTSPEGDRVVPYEEGDGTDI